MPQRQIAKEIKKRFGGKDVLFSEEMSELIGSDHRVVKCLRAGLSIPIPTVKQGRKWGIKVNDVAEWMASRATTSSSNESTLLANRRLQAPARQRESLGRSLLALQTQLESLEAQLEFVREIYEETILLEQFAIDQLEEETQIERIITSKSKSKSIIK